MGGTPGTVIVVDDDDAVRNALKFSLQLEGLDVHAYATGAALLAEADVPDRACLVIDYHMPGLDGLALVARLAERGIRRPTLLITGKATAELRRRAEGAGVIDVLEKPLDDGSLLEEIRRALAGFAAPAC